MPMHVKVGFHTIGVKLHHRCATNLVGYAHLIFYSEQSMSKTYRTGLMMGTET